MPDFPVAHCAEIIEPHSAQRNNPVNGKSCRARRWRGRSFVFNIFCTASNNAGEIIGSKLPSNHSPLCFTKPIYALCDKSRLMEALASGAQNVKERHHARFWKTNLQTANGERVYVGTVSFDSGIKWLVTHKISPDIDTERELLFADLQNAGLVATSSKDTFVSPVLGQNFSGDQFFTDGKIYVLVLENK